MGYELRLIKFDNDFISGTHFEKSDWLECSTDERFRFVEKGEHSGVYLEFLKLIRNNYHPIIWISSNFKSASLKSEGLVEDIEFQENLAQLAEKLGACIMGDNTELYYIPGFGKIDPTQELIDQGIISVTELINQKIKMNQNDGKLENFINQSIKSQPPLPDFTKYHE